MSLSQRQSRRQSRGLRLLSAIALALTTLAHAQETTPTPQTLEEALHQLSDQAGVVFVGEVVAIRHRSGENGASGIVEIDFHIDQAIRGCTTGSIYTLREWAGLWSGGDQRYRIGQHLLMLLHTPGPAGITSPVGGMAGGAIPIRGAATTLTQQPANTEAIAATTNKAATTTTPSIADLRWVGTRVLRPTSNLQPTASLTIATAKTTATQTTTPSTPSVSDTSTASQQAPITTIVNMLTTWQGTPHEAP